MGFPNGRLWESIGPGGRGKGGGKREEVALCSPAGGWKQLGESVFPMVFSRFSLSRFAFRLAGKVGPFEGKQKQQIVSGIHLHGGCPVAVP